MIRCIHENNYKPGKQKFFKQINGQTKITSTPTRRELYLGVELEMEVPGRTNILRTLSCINVPWLYAVKDESLIHGVELVSRPMTYRFFNNNRNTIIQYLNFFKSKGALGWGKGNAGIHVHMSKEAFTEKQLMNFQNIIYNYPDLTRLISGKTNSSLKMWSALEQESRDDMKYKARLKRHPAEVGRYVAVNLLNKGTVEIRIFRSTLHPQHFFKNIEFCVALYEYSGVRDTVSLNGFLAWVKTHQRRYRELHKFLSKHKVI